MCKLSRLNAISEFLQFMFKQRSMCLSLVLLSAHPSVGRFSCSSRSDQTFQQVPFESFDEETKHFYMLFNLEIIPI